MSAYLGPVCESLVDRSVDSLCHSEVTDWCSVKSSSDLCCD